ncbi:MAG TPA: hypothetical protein VKE51_21610 [Vicinamibacterales bacterium]|nr:hypothetical protein [Vicinamibacterales bacterium]
MVKADMVKPPADRFQADEETSASADGMVTLSAARECARRCDSDRTVMSNGEL